MTTAASPARSLKARLRAGEPALGLNVRLGRSADVARIARGTGHDFLFIDAQHAVFDLETVAHIAGAAQALGVAPLVRVRGVGDPDVPRMLDAGVAGIVFPDVETPEEARRAVEAVRFAPLGRRSVGGGHPWFDFKPMPTRDLMARLDEEVLLVCMIETVKGLAAVEAIAAVPGIDVLHVGSNDLLADMGKPGQFDCPEIVDAQARVIAAARARGLVAGCGGNRDVARQAAAIRAGALFVTTQTDIAFLMSAAARWTEDVRREIATREAEGGPGR